MKKRKPLRILLFLVVFAAVVILFARAYITAVATLKGVAQSEMENVANAAIHYAVREAATNGGGYTGIVNIMRDKDGKIQTLTLDSAKANLLKSEIALKTLQYLADKERSEISVPVGNFTGIEFLTGFGPEIKMKIIPCSIANVDFESSFKQAGINQVCHTVSVRVDVDIGALLPRFEEISRLSSSALVAEAVIVGDVPDTYLNLGDRYNDGQH